MGRDTQARRETAGKAKAELERRTVPAWPGTPAAAHGPAQTTTESWREFEANIQAVERAIARQHQAAIDTGEPWPPQHTPEPDPGSAPQTSPENQSMSAQPEQDDWAARLDKLLERADDAAQRLAVQRAERQVGRKYTARLEREAQAEPETQQQAEAREEAEIEM